MSAISNPTPEQLQALLNGPGLVPPPGVIPNFIDPPNLRHTAIAVQVVTLVLSTFAVAMRIYTKAYIKRQMAAADYAILLGWGVFVGYFIPSWFATEIAPGVNQWNVQLKNIGPFFYYIHVGTLMYGWSIFFIKLSILLQYVQVFVPLNSRNAIYWTSHALIWTNMVFYIISEFLEGFACKPIAKAWDPLITNGHCINILAINVAASSINSVSDIAILVLPQVTIWRLQMALKRKIQISAIFLIGFFACVSAVIRLSYAIKLYRATDLTYYTWLTGVWTLPEMASGIIVACLPVVGKFFQGVKETRAFSRVGSSLKSLFNFTIVASQRSTDNPSAENRTTSNAPTFRNAKVRPGQYETLPDGQPLVNSPRETLTDTTFGDDGDHQSEAYIMRTIDIEAHSESKGHNPSYSTNGPARLWQGEGFYGTNVEA